MTTLNLTFKASVLAAACALANLTMAAVPNTFTNGEAADADKVNANFTDLDTRLTTLETAASGSGTSTGTTATAVDCTSDPSALETAINSGDTNLEISGLCYGEFTIAGKNVVITGVDDGSGTAPSIDFIGNTSGPALTVKQMGALTLNSLALNGASDETPVLDVAGGHVTLNTVTIACGGNGTGKHAIAAKDAVVDMTSVSINDGACSSDSLMGYEGAVFNLITGNTIVGPSGATGLAVAAHLARHASLDLAQDGANTLKSHDSAGGETGAIYAHDNAEVRVQSGNTLGGAVSFNRNSTLTVGNVTWDSPDGIYAYAGSVVNLSGLSSSTLCNFEIRTNSVLYMENSAISGAAECGTVDVDFGSSLHLVNTTIDTLPVRLLRGAQIWLEAGDGSSYLGGDMTIDNATGLLDTSTYVGGTNYCFNNASVWDEDSGVDLCPTE